MGSICTCPICKKKFINNGMSVYKLEEQGKIVRYCSYNCWRKAGGDNGKRRYAKK